VSQAKRRPTLVHAALVYHTGAVPHPLTAWRYNGGRLAGRYAILHH